MVKSQRRSAPIPAPDSRRALRPEEYHPEGLTFFNPLLRVLRVLCGSDFVESMAGFNPALVSYVSGMLERLKISVRPVKVNLDPPSR